MLVVLEPKLRRPGPIASHPIYLPVVSSDTDFQINLQLASLKCKMIEHTCTGPQPAEFITNPWNQVTCLMLVVKNHVTLYGTLLWYCLILVQLGKTNHCACASSSKPPCSNIITLAVWCKARMWTNEWENWQLVTDGPVEFEEWPVEVKSQSI